MRTAIVTLVLGRPYHLAWHDVCAPGWRAYAHRHEYDLIVIDRPMDRTPRAMARSPAWQKCLVLDPAIAGCYDRIVWIDADIIINEQAPAVTSTVPIEKIGAVDDLGCPTPEARRAFWERMVAQTKSTNPEVARIWQSYLDPRDYHGFWGLPRRGDHIVQTGVMVLSPRHHRELLEYVYHCYENKGGAEMNYEMRPLSFEIQESKLAHWIDPRFNAVFNAILSDANARRKISTEQELFDLIRRSREASYFLHFCAHQQLLTAARMALSAAA
jgi:hypothetical protein